MRKWRSRQTVEQEALDDELIDIRVKISLLSEEASPDQDKLAELLARLSEIESQIQQERPRSP